MRLTVWLALIAAVYVVSYFGFAAFSYGVAWAPNFAALLIFRFLAAFCGTTSLSIVPASINDQFGLGGLNWAVPCASSALAIELTGAVALSAFAGPSLGPFRTFSLPTSGLTPHSRRLRACHALCFAADLCRSSRALGIDGT